MLYTSSALLYSAVTMVAGFCVVQWVSPAELGLWQSVRLATTYSIFALIGINNGLSRELPFFMGKSDHETSRRLASTAMFYVLGVCLFAMIGGVGSFLLFRDHGGHVMFAIGAVTVAIAGTFYSNYLTVTFRSSKSFEDLTKVNFSSCFLGLASISLIYWFGYYGMLMRVILLSVVGLGLMHLWRPIRVLPAWDSRSFLLLFRTGWPIFLMGYLYSVASTCDRLVLLKLGGVEQVGYYSMALLARDAMGIVPGSLSEYIYPRMSFSYGQHGDPLRLWKMALKSSALVTVITAPLAIAGCFLIPSVVSSVAPNYSNAVTPAQMLVAGAVFSGMTGGGARNVIESMKAWRIMFWYQMLGASFVIFGPIVGGFYFTKPLLGVSVGLLVGQILWCPVAWYLIYIATHQSGSIPTAGTPDGSLLR